MFGKTGFMVVVLMLVLGASPAPMDASGATQAKRCKPSEVKTKIKYTRPSARRQSFTACLPRSVKEPASPAAGRREARRIARKLAPKRVARALRGRAARRVSAADALTDTALHAALQTPAGAPARRSRPIAGATTVTHFDTIVTLGPGSPGGEQPSGTRTTVRTAGFVADDEEPNPGGEREVTTETTSTRIAGLSARTTKAVKVSKSMAQCPDAAGLAQGVIHGSLRETRYVDAPGGGQYVTQERLQADLAVTVQFSDDGNVASVTTTGTWSWSDTTRLSPRRGASGRQLSHHGVGGGMTGTDQALTPTVTNATSPLIAPFGTFFGTLARDYVEGVASDLRSALEKRAQNGICVRVKPDPVAVRVAPGGSATIKAQVLDVRNTPLSGAIKSRAVRGAVSPVEASASPTATFTYAAARDGRTDTVVLFHASRRGRALVEVPVTYEEEVINRLSGDLTISSVVDYRTDTCEGDRNLGTDCVNHTEAQFTVAVRLVRDPGGRWVDRGSTWTADVDRTGTDRNGSGTCTGTYASRAVGSGSGFNFAQLAYTPGQPAGTTVDLQLITSDFPHRFQGTIVGPSSCAGTYDLALPAAEQIPAEFANCPSAAQRWRGVVSNVAPGAAPRLDFGCSAAYDLRGDPSSGNLAGKVTVTAGGALIGSP